MVKHKTNLAVAESGEPGKHFLESRSRPNSHTGSNLMDIVDEFDDDCLDDGELMAARKEMTSTPSFEPEVLIFVIVNDIEFNHIDAFDDSIDCAGFGSTTTTRKPSFGPAARIQDRCHEAESQEPRQLESGKWACNHKCKNKKT